MLAGMQDVFSEGPLAALDVDMSVGESMFETLGKLPPGRIGPDPREMAAQMEQVTKYQKVKVKEFVVRTYDLGDEAQRTQYQYDMENIMIGVQMRTHALTYKAEPQFINDNKGPRYIAHMEWVEFNLTQTPVPTVGNSRRKELGDGTV